MTELQSDVFVTGEVFIAFCQGVSVYIIDDDKATCIWPFYCSGILYQPQHYFWILIWGLVLTHFFMHWTEHLLSRVIIATSWRCYYQESRIVDLLASNYYQLPLFSKVLFCVHGAWGRDGEFSHKQRVGKERSGTFLAAQKGLLLFLKSTSENESGWKGVDLCDAECLLCKGLVTLANPEWTYGCLCTVKVDLK